MDVAGLGDARSEVGHGAGRQQRGGGVHEHHVAPSARLAASIERTIGRVGSGVPARDVGDVPRAMPTDSGVIS